MNRDHSYTCCDTGYQSTTSITENQDAKDESSILKQNLKRNLGTLVGAVNKIEEMLRILSLKHTCGLSNCKSMIELELGKIRSVKSDLQSQINNCEKYSEEPTSCKGLQSLDSQCNLIHLEDIEKFKEKSVAGVVTLEQMKEQIDILEKIVKQYVVEFPCDCDRSVVEKCEDKLEKLRTDYDDISAELHCIFQKFCHPPIEETYKSLGFEDTLPSTAGEWGKNESNFSLDVCDLKSEHQKLQKQICDQENAAEKLKRLSKQLDKEIQEKRRQLIEQNKEIDSKICEISRLRELIRRVYRRLKEVHFEPNKTYNEEYDSSSIKNVSGLSGLLCDLQKLECILVKLVKTLFDEPKKLKDDNEKLKEKLDCLEKCICNKEETLRLLQDTVKLRECQIEELKSKMQTSESNSSKLAQDVEEKCRLISNLQEAVRQCKQFQVNMELVESLRFECCELNCKLENCEKEILLKDKKLESLHSEVTDLSSQNFFLTEKIKIIDPKLKIMYKTCHLFEKTVNDLQQELNARECEIETLYAKIKDLEGELNAEFRKCEDKAAHDSKYIEELSLTVQNFQKDLECAQSHYNTSIIETEKELKEQFEMRERELGTEICCLKAEIRKLKNQAQEAFCENDTINKANNIDCITNQPKSQDEMYKEKILELQEALEKVSEKHEMERNSILQKLCDEKQDNLKNKNLITKLNESIRRKMAQEKRIKECIEHCAEDIKSLKAENQDLRTEVEARKKIMCTMEKENTNLTEFEELICSLKIQKADLKTKCCNLKAEVEKEVKLKRLLECRLDDLNSILQCKMEEFNQVVEKYKCTSMKIYETCERMKKIEESLICSQRCTAANHSRGLSEDHQNLCNLLDIKTSENAKLICQLQILKVEMESVENENELVQAAKDAAMADLEQEIECLSMDLQEFQIKCQKMDEENKKLRSELEFWMNKGITVQKIYKEKQKELCGQLKTTICEKNNLLDSLNDLQRQLEQICIENLNKEKKNRELSEECSRLKINNDSIDSCIKNKSVKIICNLKKEIQNLQCELNNTKENFDILNEEYQALLERLKCCEKKKCNLEKLYTEVNNDNKDLAEAKANYEREICELKTQNLLLKDKINNKGENFKNAEEKNMCDVIKELIAKIKTLEKKVIPELHQEINEKIGCIENLKVELRDANISNQKMRSEAMRVIQHTRKYLAAQRCANETLKTRLECSNKRGNMLGIENRELEDQLKAVTRMNEFLLSQLESAKTDVGEAEPRSFSPLPWSCSTVERDTSSSEYLAESGFQSMQPSPTNVDCIHDSQCDFKRNNNQWNSLKKYRGVGSVEYPSCWNGIR